MNEQQTAELKELATALVYESQLLAHTIKKGNSEEIKKNAKVCESLGLEIRALTKGLQNGSQAYEMLGVCEAKGFRANVEALGGGALGVTIPLGAKHYGLLTSDHGLGVYEQTQFEETGEPLTGYWFAFNDEYELESPLWEETAKALDWLTANAIAKGWN